MAKFNTVGLDDIISDMEKRPDLVEAAAPEVLNAQAEILVKAQKAEAETLQIRETGEFIDSIKPTKIKEDKDGLPYIDVYPQGKDKKGVRNAEKGFIAEFGTSKIEARPWMSTANNKAAGEMSEKAHEIWNKYTNEGGSD